MTNINFDEPSTGNVNSDDKTALAIKNTGGGGGMICESTNDGVIGKSTNSIGVRGESGVTSGVIGLCIAQFDATEPRRHHPSRAAIAGYSTSLGWGYGVAGNIKGVGGAGLWGVSDNDAGSGIGVRGESKNGVGVYGASQRNDGVHGESNTTGVVGISNGKAGAGIFGETVNPEGGAGVWGKSKNWVGVFGESQTNVGVKGEAKSDHDASGVFGICNGGKSVNGVKGTSTGGIGVLGESATYVAILGRAPTAGRFEGDVEVTGDIRLLNADCAEDFDVSARDGQTIQPGTVMVLNDDGNLEPSYQAYDKKVAGVISGAGGYKPGIVLDKQQQQSEDNAKTRMPVALMGKVYCKVDATLSPVEVGDLLTTSSIEGHAMKASDPIKAFGTVIGKALKPLKEGKGLIPVLVTLQ